MEAVLCVGTSGSRAHAVTSMPSHAADRLPSAERALRLQRHAFQHILLCTPSSFLGGIWNQDGIFHLALILSVKSACGFSLHFSENLLFV